MTTPTLRALRDDIRYAMDNRHRWSDQDDANWRILDAVKDKAFLVFLEAALASPVPDSEPNALENDIRELRDAKPGELARRLIERGWHR